MVPADIDRARVLAARERIAPHVPQTPVERSAWLSERTGTPVHLKLECYQRTGSFKVRGAVNAVASLDAEARARGLVTASAGNHGQGVALAAAAFDARATIFVPASAPKAKKRRIRRFGAELRDTFASYDEAEDAAVAWAQREGLTFVHAFSDPAVVAGQGTVGLEILEQVPDVRTVVVPVGGGGLLAGIGAAFEDRDIRLIGVQSDRTPNVHASLAAGRLVDCPVVPTLADGLAGRTDAISVERVAHYADSVELVPDDALAPAIRALCEQEGVVAEGAGVVPVAFLEANAPRLEGPVVLVISGRNIDGAVLARILRDEPWR